MMINPYLQKISKNDEKLATTNLWEMVAKDLWGDVFFLVFSARLGFSSDSFGKETQSLLEVRCLPKPPLDPLAKQHQPGERWWNSWGI